MIVLFVSVEATSGNGRFESDVDVAGYYQTLGVTANDEGEFKSLIQQYLGADMQSELVGIDEKWVPDFEGSDADIRDQIGDTAKVGIWYSSGRAWFWPEEDDNEGSSQNH